MTVIWQRIEGKKRWEPPVRWEAIINGHRLSMEMSEYTSEWLVYSPSAPAATPIIRGRHYPHGDGGQEYVKPRAEAWAQAQPPGPVRKKKVASGKGRAARGGRASKDWKDWSAAQEGWTEPATFQPATTLLWHGTKRPAYGWRIYEGPHKVFFVMTSITNRTRQGRTAWQYTALPWEVLPNSVRAAWTKLQAAGRIPKNAIPAHGIEPLADLNYLLTRGVRACTCR